MPETARKPSTAAEWLEVISGQLAELQGTANRIEQAASEFVPPLRSLVAGRVAKLAARGNRLWDRPDQGTVRL